MPVRPVLLLTLAALATAAPAAPPKKAPAKPAAAKKGVPANTATHWTVDPGIAKAVADTARPAADRARDKYRHPAQTLSFFGLKPDTTVIEVMPAKGWYAAIIAPFVADQGHYIAAASTDDDEGFQQVVTGDAARYGKVQVAPFTHGVLDQVPAGTADLVLTFRNIHNLLGDADTPGDGVAPQAFASWFAALKPGGTLGVVEHRLPENMDVAREKTTGYVKRSTVIRLAMAAGFRLVAASDINANPKDDHDHPDGVWDLPPTYKAGDTDKAKYTAIGESDRMTLKFVKPDPNAPVSNERPAEAPAAVPADAAPPPADNAAAPANEAAPVNDASPK